MVTQEIKKMLLDHVQKYADSRVNGLQHQIRELQQDLATESKSTAGDKHETGRAMMQLELETLGSALKEAEFLQNLARRIQISGPESLVVLSGSLVECQGKWYFLSVSAGCFRYQGISYYCVSSQSPVGKQLLGKAVGDTISLPAGDLQITGVY
jgi:hypothetical protein